ncbi:MAG: RHS repeat protein [Chloroflexi bacterium]|nr:RHS repeat protein [Chloroflexota bacterium]
MNAKLSHTPTAPTTTANYTYDAAGRLTQAEYANGVVIKYTYDKAGNLVGREVGKK